MQQFVVYIKNLRMTLAYRDHRPNGESDELGKQKQKHGRRGIRRLYSDLQSLFFLFFLSFQGKFTTR
jgi:hypothetical protein